MGKTLAVITTFGGELPDNSLPGEQPGIDNSLPRPERPVDPGFGIPLPPVIDNSLPKPPHRPTYPVDPDYGIPTRPSVWPGPPIHGKPPLPPLRPDLPIYLPPPNVDNSLPLHPGAVWPPLAPGLDGKLLAFVWIVGVGYRWTVIDTSLKPDIGLPPGIDNTLPPSPGPKK